MSGTDKAHLIHWILGGIGLLALPWAAGVLLFVGGGATGILWWRWLGLVVWIGLGVGIWMKSPPRRRWWTPWLLFLLAMVVQISVRPTNHRDWSEDQSRVPWIEVDGDTLHVHEIRNFRYQSASEWTADWYDANYNLSDLEDGYFVVEHFNPDVDAIAHTLVSFRFKGDRFLAVSVEIRKEKGEAYSPLRGLFRQFELIYVVADEEDVLKLRTHVRDSRVAIHRMHTDMEGLRAYFMDVVGRINTLKKSPEFYHTLSSSCTTNLAKHLEAVTRFQVMWDKRVYLPGYSSELAWELGLLGKVSLAEALERDTVTDERRAAAETGGGYSLQIRGESAPEPFNDEELKPKPVVEPQGSD